MNLACAARSTRHSHRKLILSLLALVVFILCASVQLVAYGAAPNASSGRAQEGAASRVRATETPSLGPTRDAAPADELAKLESEDREDDAGLHGPVANLRVRFKPVACRARHEAGAVYADWAHPSVVEFALPRGPP